MFLMLHLANVPQISVEFAHEFQSRTSLTSQRWPARRNCRKKEGAGESTKIVARWIICKVAAQAVLQASGDQSGVEAHALDLVNFQTAIVCLPARAAHGEHRLSCRKSRGARWIIAKWSACGEGLLRAS